MFIMPFIKTQSTSFYPQKIYHVLESQIGFQKSSFQTLAEGLFLD